MSSQRTAFLTNIAATLTFVAFAVDLALAAAAGFAAGFAACAAATGLAPATGFAANAPANLLFPVPNTSPSEPVSESLCSESAAAARGFVAAAAAVVAAAVGFALGVGEGEAATAAVGPDAVGLWDALLSGDNDDATAGVGVPPRALAVDADDDGRAANAGDSEPVALLATSPLPTGDFTPPLTALVRPVAGAAALSLLGDRLKEAWEPARLPTLAPLPLLPLSEPSGDKLKDAEAAVGPVALPPVGDTVVGDLTRTAGFVTTAGDESLSRSPSESASMLKENSTSPPDLCELAGEPKPAAGDDTWAVPAFLLTPSEPPGDDEEPAPDVNAAVDVKPVNWYSSLALGALALPPPKPVPVNALPGVVGFAAATVTDGPRAASGDDVFGAAAPLAALLARPSGDFAGVEEVLGRRVPLPPATNCTLPARTSSTGIRTWGTPPTIAGICCTPAAAAAAALAEDAELPPAALPARPPIVADCARAGVCDCGWPCCCAARAG